MKADLESKLAQILAMRKQRKSYREICVELGKEGILVEHGNLHRWLKRQRQKAARLAEELAPFEALENGKTKSQKPLTALEKINRARESAQVEKKEPVFRFDAEEIRKAQ